MDDVRWMAPNRYCALPVPLLRERGIRIATGGDAPARLVLAADGSCAVAAFEYALRHRAPLVLYLWDLPPWWLGAGRPDLVFVAGGRIRRLPRPFAGYRKRAGYYSRMGYAARRSLQVWTPSSASRDDVRAKFAVSTERVPFCYDSDRFGSAGHGAPPPPTSPPTVLSVSRLEPHKNQALVVRAAARLGEPVQVRLIGRGSEAARLRGLAEELGVQCAIDEAAMDDEVVAGYRSASVIVCPSRFEGLGLTPLEGLAIGRIVLASDIPPHREFVGERARYFHPDDEIGLAELLRAALAESRSPRAPSPTAELTIAACAERFGSRLESILGTLR